MWSLSQRIARAAAVLVVLIGCNAGCNGPSEPVDRTPVLGKLVLLDRSGSPVTDTAIGGIMVAVSGVDINEAETRQQNSDRLFFDLYSGNGSTNLLVLRTVDQQNEGSQGRLSLPVDTRIENATFDHLVVIDGSNRLLQVDSLGWRVDLKELP